MAGHTLLEIYKGIEHEDSAVVEIQAQHWPDSCTSRELDRTKAEKINVTFKIT